MSPGLKPDWFSDIKLFSVKKLNILWYNSLSNVLPETSIKETERYFFSARLLHFWRQEPRWFFFILRETSPFLNMNKKYSYWFANRFITNFQHSNICHLKENSSSYQTWPIDRAIIFTSRGNIFYEFFE